MEDGRQQLERARNLVEDASRILVLTGAGISTDSGIPDFRGPQGIWTKNPEAEKLSTLQHYMSDPDVRRRAWRSRVDSPAWTAQPNVGHHVLLELERLGKLHTLVTQNIDGLHHAAGTDPSKIVEIHGTMREAMCMRCDVRLPMEVVLDRVRSGEDDPRCTELGCGGILKSATISFGQDLVVEDLLRSERAARECDLVLVVGSSLSVYPAAGLVPEAKHNGAKIVIVNGEPTDFDSIADAVVRSPISEVLPKIVGGAGE